jgi:hypothetical protein
MCDFRTFLDMFYTRDQDGEATYADIAKCYQDHFGKPTSGKTLKPLMEAAGFTYVNDHRGSVYVGLKKKLHREINAFKEFIHKHYESDKEGTVARDDVIKCVREGFQSIGDLDVDDLMEEAGYDYIRGNKQVYMGLRERNDASNH